MNVTTNVLILLFLILGVVVYILSAILFYQVQKRLRNESNSHKLVLGCRIIGVLCVIFGLLLFILYFWPTINFLFPVA